MRVWDSGDGSCFRILELRTIEGYNGLADGAVALTDGQLLSWSKDGTLRLWDYQSRLSTQPIEGHTDRVQGVAALPNEQILSWSNDKCFRLWDSESGTCLEVVPEIQTAYLHPEWLSARQGRSDSDRIVQNWILEHTKCNIHLRDRTSPERFAAWHADSEAETLCLLHDGTVVATQANGQVCILKLHHGNRRVSLAEAEEILALQKKTAK